MIARPRDIVVLRALGLGDFLTSVPALRALRRALPEHRLLVAMPRALGPLAKLSGAVGEVIDVRELEPLDGTPKEPDLAVNLHGRGPESHRVLLELRPRRFLAYTNADVPQTHGFPEWDESEHEVRRWCRLLEENAIPADPLDLRLNFERDRKDAAVRDATVLHPGAKSPARRWPVERWVEVARAETAAGNRVIVSAGPGEEGLARAVAEAAHLDPANVHLNGDVMSLTRLVASARQVASGDTGVAHLATALGTPSVVLFGPTPPALWGPLIDESRHVVLWAGTTGDPWAYEPDPGLLEILPQDVLEALASLPD